MSHSCGENLREPLRVKEGRGGQESFKGMEITDCVQFVGYQGETRLPFSWALAGSAGPP